MMTIVTSKITHLSIFSYSLVILLTFHIEIYYNRFESKVKQKTNKNIMHFDNEKKTGCLYLMKHPKRRKK